MTESTRCAILSAWALTIRGYTSFHDVVFGEWLSDAESVFTERQGNHAETATIVPRRFQFDDAWTVAELISKVKIQLESAKPYQWAGLSHIQNLNADTARACDFKNLISITDNRGHGPRPISTQQQDINLPHYPLLIDCVLEDAALKLVISYDDSTLTAAQTERLAAQFFACVEILNSESSMSKTIGILSRDNMDFCSFRHDVAYWRNYLEDIEA
ncbi:hypothetical protein AbraIFM66951_010774, partial [Aspergillus brasiliensis]